VKDAVLATLALSGSRDGLRFFLVLSVIAAAGATLLSKAPSEGGRMSRYPLSRKQPAAAGEAAPRNGRSSSADRVGRQVADILAAAEKAAGRIEEEARQEGERLREQAQREAATATEATVAAAEATKKEAERIKAAAEESTKRMLAAAERDATKRRAEAENEAKRIVSAAEQRAESTIKRGQKRRQELESDLAAIEERIRQLSRPVHDLAARLDTLSAAASPAEVTNDTALEQGTEALAPSPSKNAKSTA
jgi:chromosome segregation ATPase